VDYSKDMEEEELDYSKDQMEGQQIWSSSVLGRSRDMLEFNSFII
jgi:hypothetical protein